MVASGSNEGGGDAAAAPQFEWLRSLDSAFRERLTGAMVRTQTVQACGQSMVLRSQRRASCLPVLYSWRQSVLDRRSKCQGWVHAWRHQAAGMRAHSASCYSAACMMARLRRKVWTKAIFGLWNHCVYHNYAARRVAAQAMQRYNWKLQRFVYSALRRLFLALRRARASFKKRVRIGFQSWFSRSFQMRRTRQLSRRVRALKSFCNWEVAVELSRRSSWLKIRRSVMLWRRRSKSRRTWRSVRVRRVRCMLSAAIVSWTCAVSLSRRWGWGFSLASAVLRQSMQTWRLRVFLAGWRYSAQISRTRVLGVEQELCHRWRTTLRSLVQLWWKTALRHRLTAQHEQVFMRQRKQRSMDFIFSIFCLHRQLHRLAQTQNQLAVRLGNCKAHAISSATVARLVVQFWHAQLRISLQRVFVSWNQSSRHFNACRQLMVKRWRAAQLRSRAVLCFSGWRRWWRKQVTCAKFEMRLNRERAVRTFGVSVRNLKQLRKCRLLLAAAKLAWRMHMAFTGFTQHHLLAMNLRNRRASLQRSTFSLWLRLVRCKRKVVRLRRRRLLPAAFFSWRVSAKPRAEAQRVLQRAFQAGLLQRLKRLVFWLWRYLVRVHGIHRRYGDYESASSRWTAVRELARNVRRVKLLQRAFVRLKSTQPPYSH